ncbi:MAG: hypothetical protein JNN08_30475 [Bryobacterales bacterium]|nr:hypothetical protein [Bryobacterales bacterium]
MHKSHNTIRLAILALLALGSTGNAQGPAGRLHLLLDDAEIESEENLRRVLHSPTPKEVVVELDRPYEDSTMYDPTVIHENGRYRMWYRANFNARPFYTGYAESTDGIRWTKPDLGLIEYASSKQNNIVWPVPGGKGHTLSFFRDDNPRTPASERYKAIGLESEQVDGKTRAVLYGMVSEDGLRWRQAQPEPIVRAPLDDPQFDAHNIALWDSARNQYVIYARGWARHKVRDIRRFTSTDFRNWSEPRYVDFGGAPIEELYKNAAIPYFRRPDIILMFPKRFLPQRKFDPQWKEDGLSDVVFTFSRDGLRFDRRFMEAFIRPGPDPLNWHERAIEAGPTLVPAGPSEMALYYMEHYRSPKVRVRRGILRTDGLVSLRGGYQGGSLVTRPLRMEGSQLLLNYSTSAVGRVRVEIQDSTGGPVAGFALADCPEIFGDEIDRKVSWKSGGDFARLAGQTVRLKIEIKDGDLYSYRIQ